MLTESKEISVENTSHLTEEQREEFNNNGFIILESILNDEEIEHYQNIITKARQKEKFHLVGNTPDQPREFNDPLQIRNAVSHYPELLSLMTHPKAFPLIVDLMGPHLSLMTSHIFYRPPTPNQPISFKQIDWHRDGPGPSYQEVNGNFPWLYTKIGYFFSDLRIPNAGALRVVPGSHKYGGKAPKGKNQEEPFGSIEVKIPAGSAVIFDNRIFHAVGPNYSNIARQNIYFGYGWRYLRPIDFTKQPHELLEKCSPIQKQLLGESVTELGYYIPHETDVPLQNWQNQRLQLRRNQ